MLDFNVLIQRSAPNTEPFSYFRLRYPLINPPLRLLNLFSSQRFRPSFINTSLFRTSNTLGLTLTNNGTLKLRHRPVQKTEMVAVW